MGPGGWAAKLRGARSLREQLRRARAKGVRVRATTAAELERTHTPEGAAARALVARWLDSRELAPMGFLVQVDPLTVRADQRLYLAERDGHLVGLLAASPIFARRGWLLQTLIRAPDAPNGTAELLVDEAMRAAAAVEDQEVTLGLAPLAGPLAWPLRFARRAGTVAVRLRRAARVQGQAAPRSLGSRSSCRSAAPAGRRDLGVGHAGGVRAWAACGGSASRPCCAGRRSWCGCWRWR